MALSEASTPKSADGVIALNDTSEESPTRIVIHYYVKNRDELPHWVRRPDGIRQKQIAKVPLGVLVAKYGALTKVGRIRPNTRDTGEQVIVAGHVTTAGLHEGLVAHGYLLSETSYFQPRKTRRDERFVIELVYRKSVQESITPDSRLSGFTTRTWGNLSVWKNPDESVTINLSGKPTGRNKNAVHSIGVEDGLLKLFPA